ncbi:hypothetical protein WUBG_05701 [Wuchereria bancrofti]|uniref:Uncharacterized protein n=1 Tax=Wuchereria bancrofti TaxID=6293 RepID=J9B8J1_WUCBA|nr:hypothetical protein WUBG_05701 [Wuchereria bancrofti]
MKTQNKGFVPDGERGRCVSGIPGKDRRRTVHIAEREGRTSERRRGSLIVNASSCTYPIHVLDGRHRTHIISFWHHSIPHTGISLRCTVFIRRRGVPYEIETMSARVAHVNRLANRSARKKFGRMPGRESRTMSGMYVSACLLVCVLKGIDRAEKCEVKGAQGTDRRADIGKGRGGESERSVCAGRFVE